MGSPFWQRYILANLRLIHIALYNELCVIFQLIGANISSKRRANIYSLLALFCNPAGLDFASSKMNIYFCALSPNASGLNKLNVLLSITSLAAFAAISSSSFPRSTLPRLFCQVPSYNATRDKNAWHPSRLMRPYSCISENFGNRGTASFKSLMMKSATSLRSFCLTYIRASVTSIGSFTKIALPYSCNKSK